MSLTRRILTDQTSRPSCHDCSNSTSSVKKMKNSLTFYFYTGYFSFGLSGDFLTNLSLDKIICVNVRLYTCCDSARYDYRFLTTCISHTPTVVQGGGGGGLMEPSLIGFSLCYSISKIFQVSRKPVMCSSRWAAVLSGPVSSPMMAAILNITQN